MLKIICSYWIHITECKVRFGYVVTKFYIVYNRIRKRVLAHVCGPQNTLTLQRLWALLRKFNIVFYMTDAWPVYRTQLDSAHHVVAK